MNHRIFERTLRPLLFRGACLFERQNNPSSRFGLVLGRARESAAALKLSGGTGGALRVVTFLATGRHWNQPKDDGR